MFITKKKPNIDMAIIDELVHSYLSYIKGLGEEFTCSEISELFRYSMCRALSLETKGYSERIERIGVGTCNRLWSVLDKYNIFNQSEDFRKGLLEACVHCMEMSRKRVLEVY